MRNSCKTKWCNKSSGIIKIQCDCCGEALDDQPRIAIKCLHRFCFPCTKGLTTCPKCNIQTKFEIDINLRGLISQLNCNTKNYNVKRKIVNVLQKDGVDLGQEKRRNLKNPNYLKSNCHSPRKTDLTCINEPSTSNSHYDHHTNIIDVGLMEGADKLKMQKFNDKFLVNFITPSITNETSQWPKMNHFISNRLPLNRNLSQKTEAIVLWPDGVNYQLGNFPFCLLRPRYLYVPSVATVAHLKEYLFKRAELEDNWKCRSKYNVEFMPIEEERDKINLWVDPKRNIDYLGLNHSTKSEKCVLVLCKRREDSYFTNLIIPHPFCPMSEKQTIAELLQNKTTNITPNMNQNNSNNFSNNWDDNVSNNQQKNNVTHKQNTPKLIFRFVPLIL